MEKILPAMVAILVTLGVQSQNVGIGITNPIKGKLEVVGVAGFGATNAAFGTDGPGISIQRNWPTIGFNQYRDDVSPGSQGKYMTNGPAALKYFDPINGSLIFDIFSPGIANTYTPASTTALVIANNGNVGIRNFNPPASLTVARGNAPDGTAAFQGADYSSYFNYASGEDTYIRSGSTNSNLYINQVPNGNVFFGNGSSKLILNWSGTQAPIHTISMGWTGDDFFALIDDYNYRWSQFFEIRSGDDYFFARLTLKYSTHISGFFSPTGFYNSLSDERLKKDIRPLTPVINKVNQLVPVSYEIAKDNPGHKRTIGFMEEDVKKIFPDLVKIVDVPSAQGRNSKWYTVNNSNFGVIMVKALQEQYQQIQALEKEEEAIVKEIQELCKNFDISSK